MDGVGGTHSFKLNALKIGESMIRFIYSRGLDDVADEIYMLVVVEDDLLIYAMDVTEAGVYDGTVIEVNAEEQSVLLNTDRMLSALSQFERDLLAERTLDGLKAAKARGHQGGRPKAGNEKMKSKAIALYNANTMTNKEITEIAGVSTATLSRWIKDYKEKNGDT